MSCDSELVQFSDVSADQESTAILRRAHQRIMHSQVEYQEYTHAINHLPSWYSDDKHSPKSKT